ncbi:MAG: glutamine synthetase, partial [Candidatus Omnitrophota bacterium]
SCWESAESFLKDREIYQQGGVFSSVTIDGIVKKLKSYNDKDLSQKLYGKEDEIKKLIGKYIHCS